MGQRLRWSFDDPAEFAGSHEIWHSGTVAAAKQAALLGVRAAVFSLALDGGEPVFAPLFPYVEQVMRLLLESPAPLLVNVNFPPSPKSLRWTYQSVRAYSGRVVEGQDPMGRRHYWFAAKPLTDPEEGTDRWAVAQGRVSLTPLRLNLTDQEWLQQLERAEKAG